VAFLVKDSLALFFIGFFHSKQEDGDIDWSGFSDRSFRLSQHSMKRNKHQAENTVCEWTCSVRHKKEIAPQKDSGEIFNNEETTDGSLQGTKTSCVRPSCLRNARPVQERAGLKGEE
jgi:hypothetical protein